MDCSLPAASDDGDLPWSDSQSMGSDDVQSDGSPSPWLRSLSTDSTSVSASASTLSYVHTGQLSPVSNSMALPRAATETSVSLASPSQSPTVPATTLQAPSSPCRGAWAVVYARREDGPGLSRVAERHQSRQHVARRECSNMLAIPKREPLDDHDCCMDDLEDAPPTPVPAVSSHAPEGPDQQKPKRPRGRPRKHPFTPVVATNKITKGRSKTGCLTCRKRKKKCDEAKPRCFNCEKNAVVCEGYPEKQIWKSGRERAEEARVRSRSFQSLPMQPLFYGLENIEDMIFWKHYNEHLSAVLTVEGEHKNAFKDMMIPIAVKHAGLMHSILSLASKHVDFETPYGLNVLRNNPTTSREALAERSIYHHEQARLKFYDDVEFTKRKPNAEDKFLVSARYGQMLCFLLEAKAEGSARGDHRLHLEAYNSLIATSPPEDSAFLSFVAEFFQYHLFADELIYSASSRNPSSAEEPPRPSISAIYPPRLLGVADGLLDYLCRITTIRNTIRSNMAAHVDPVVDYQIIYQAADIDVGIREWTAEWPPGDSRDRVGLLYQYAMWVYLVRTVHPPSPSPTLSVASSAMSLPLDPSSSSLGRPVSSPVNPPPKPVATSCASSPRRTGGSGHGPSSGYSRSDSRLYPSLRTPASPETKGAASAQGNNENRADSPLPIRQPPHHDPRVGRWVEESLALLETFKPSDPSQTLLLLPCFLVGTACFSPNHQKRVRAAIKTVRGYTGLRNADRVVDLLEEVWQLMEAGDWEAAWDWPGVARGMGLDFLPA